MKTDLWARMESNHRPSVFRLGSSKDTFYLHKEGNLFIIITTIFITIINTTITIITTIMTINRIMTMMMI